MHRRHRSRRRRQPLVQRNGPHSRQRTKLLPTVMAMPLRMTTVLLPVLPVLLPVLLAMQEAALSPSPIPRPWQNTAYALEPMVWSTLQAALRPAASSPAPQTSLVHGGVLSLSLAAVVEAAG